MGSSGELTNFKDIEGIWEIQIIHSNFYPNCKLSLIFYSSEKSFYLPFLTPTCDFNKMASQSESNTTPHTPILMEDEPRESSTPQQQDDLNVSRGATSPLPVVDLSDDPERRTQLRYSSYHGRILSSLSRTAPNLTAPHKNTQPLRRNPSRLARPASSIGIPQTRRRSTSFSTKKKKEK